MATQDDQPRPDLDAAIDAVVPSLTAVSDDAAATSLRRTRIALADAAPARGGVGGWRWAVAAAIAMTVALFVVSVWRPVSPVEAPRVATADVPPLPTKSLPTTPTPAARTPLPSRTIAHDRVVGAETARLRPDRRRSAPVRATSAPAVAVLPRPDPLVALERAVREIPEQAWSASLARARSPMSLPDVALNPIVLPELVTPPIADVSVDANAPGDF